MVDELPEGWYVPIQRALTRADRDHVGGVPFGFGVLNCTFTLAMTLGAQKWWVLPLGLVIHALAVAAVRVDPHFFEVLKEHIQSKSHYDV